MINNFEKKEQQDSMTPQWFIITAIGGKEDSVVEALIEKIKNFGYENYVNEIKVFKQNIITEEVFPKNSPEIPKSPKVTKTIRWEVLPDGSYKRIKTRVVNRFPGYVFINMVMDPQVWYTVRNTLGVLGFVGSSGKGALPIPITEEEFQRITNQSAQAKPIQNTISNSEGTSETQPSSKIEHACQFKINDQVEIIDESLGGTIAVVKNINNETGVATVQLEMFGRPMNVDFKFEFLKPIA